MSVPITNQTYTKEQLQTFVPKGLKIQISDEYCQKVNDILLDPEIGEEYVESFISYLDVLKNTRFTLKNYIDAVKYVSFKLREDSNVAAYSKTFPHKVLEFQNKGIVDYSPWVARYNGSKLVNAILEQTMIPTHILNAHNHQKAINYLSGVLDDISASPKVKVDAATSLLTHLKPPEIQKSELNINYQESSSIDDLRKTTVELAKLHKEMIESGSMTAKESAHQKIIIEDAEYTEN